MSLSRDLALCCLLCVDLCFVLKISQIDDDNLPVNPRNVAVWETAAKTAAVRFETVTARANPKPSLIKLKHKVYIM